MRLQLSIQRHALPPIQIIFIIGAGPASHTKSQSATIADLLQDVDDVVPLESADGEWGLEDYVVEVAATGDRQTAYECLHFYPVRSVLREDDEVVIRALSTEELRVRRLGGRHQISGSGRHLIDGVAFGKQWLRRRRPLIVIPRRKKRRLELDDTGDDMALGWPAQQVHEAAAPYQLQVMSRQDLDGAGIDSDVTTTTTTSTDEDVSEDDTPLNADDEDLAEKVKFLREDARRISRPVPEPSPVPALESLPRFLQTRKRKRVPDEDENGEEHGFFEGFSTPSKSAGRGQIDHDSADSDADSLVAEMAAHRAEKRTRNLIPDDVDEEESDSDVTPSESSPSESDHDSMMEEIAEEPARRRALNITHEPDESTTSDSDVTSGSDSTSAGSRESDSASSGSDSDGSTSASETDAEDTSDGSSDTESSSSSECDLGGDKKNMAQALPRPSQSNISQTGSILRQGALQPEKPPAVPPGHGSGRTKNNNLREKKKKLLKHLKQQGLLPADADFQALYAYQSAPGQEVQEVPESERRHQAEDRAEKCDLLERREAVTDPPHDAQAGNVATPECTPRPESTASTGMETGPSVQANLALSGQLPVKRPRLDLASSRRMLFGSLGLSTPKTPAAEQALREKLSTSFKPFRPAETRQDPTCQGSGAEDNSWEDKLIVAAVECEREGTSMDPPPFPFQQGWSKTGERGKRVAKTTEQYVDGTVADMRASQRHVPDTAQDSNAVPLQGGNGSGSVDESRTPAERVHAENIPVPADYTALPDLTEARVMEGAIVAYKELYMNEATHYQPEISSYRVARVKEVDNDGTIRLIVSQKDRIPEQSVKYDEKTGERVFGKFEIRLGDDDDEPSDDGMREMQFSNMIEAKLVQASDDHVQGLRGDGADKPGDLLNGQAQGQPAKVLVEQIEVDTPRRTEITTIIKEAGFNSAIDEQLLQSIASPSPQVRQSDPQPWLDTLSPCESLSQGPQSVIKESVDVQAHWTSGSSPLSGRPDIRDSLETDGRNGQDGGARGLEASHGNAPSSPAPGQSSPPVSTQETVEYPHIAPMDINSSTPPNNLNSSSHQDAQKISPMPPPDLSFATSEQDRNGSNGSGGSDEPLKGLHNPDDAGSFASLDSEVPQSQDPNEQANGPGAGLAESSPQTSSFLEERGSEGPDSSYHDEEPGENEGDDSLPSLYELTSSRNHRKTINPELARPSHPPLKSLRNGKERSASNSLNGSKAPLSSKRGTKLLESQREVTGSQTPFGRLVVDLTMSSDPRIPEHGDGDSRIGKGKEDKVNGPSRAKRRTPAQSNGLGTRRYLTTKKTRSII